MAGRKISSLPAVAALSAGAMVEVAQDGVSHRVTVAQIARKRLTADTSFYVRVDGSDDNDGLASTAARAKRTHQGVIDMLMREYDLNGWSVTIETDNNGAFTYPGFDVVGKFVGDNGSNIVTVRGNPANASTVVITGTSDDALYMEDARLKVSGITFKSVTAGRGWLVRRLSYLEHADCRFDDCANETILTTEGAVVAASGPLEVVGDSTSFIHATGNSRVSFESTTVTFSGNPTFTPYVIGINNAWVSFASGTVVGAKQGQTLVHISGILNLSSMAGRIYGNSAPVVEAGGMIIPPDAQNTIYVRADGSDSNDGYYNTAAGAFLTIAAAIEFLARRPYDPHASRTPTIQVGPGTWTVPVVLKDIPNADSVTIVGDETTPTNVVINVAGTCFSAAFLKTVWAIKGFRVDATVSGISAVGGSRLLFQKIVFANCSFSHITVGRNALVEAIGNYTIASSTTYHVFMVGGRLNIPGVTVTISGAPAWGAFFASVTDLSLAILTATWSGAATGARYSLSGNSVIDANGAGTSSLPGNAAGSAASGGQYV